MLNFSEPGGSNTNVAFGEASDANDGGIPDVYDVMMPPAPPMPPYIRSWFDDDLPNPYNLLWKDCRQYPDTSKVWNLSVQWMPTDYSTPTDITISWNVNDLDDSEYNVVVLYDVSSSSVVANMLVDTQYTFNASAMVPKALQIICSVNEHPVFSDENPSDGSVDVPLTTSQLTVTIRDPEGDSFDWSIETSPDIGSSNGVGESNGTKICSVCDLDYSTTYTWYVNATDSVTGTSGEEVYTFTTLNNPPYTPSDPDPYDDEMYPDVRHVEDITFVCTFVKNEELYTCNTTDGGITWSVPIKVAENVVEEYKTSDICESAAKGMWEIDNGEDIDIHVGYLEEFSDTEPPVTTCELDGIMEGGVYITDVTVTLTATDDMSGVNYTMYKINDGEWQEYSSFVVSEDGAHTVSFYSIDIAGNTEDPKTESFTIQHPCPIEIIISGGLGVNAVVTNTGEEDIIDLEWSINITGGILGRINKEVSGIIPSLAVNEMVTVESGIFFGLGKIAVTVTANGAEETVTGKQFIIFTKVG